jgi:hypothetical protein
MQIKFEAGNRPAPFRGTALAKTSVGIKGPAAPAGPPPISELPDDFRVSVSCKAARRPIQANFSVFGALELNEVTAAAQALECSIRQGLVQHQRARKSFGIKWKKRCHAIILQR